jgi:hypothetical protein
MSQPYADKPILCPDCGSRRQITEVEARKLDHETVGFLRARIRGLEERIEKLLATNDKALATFHDLEIEHGLRDDASGPKSPGPRCIYCQQTRAGTPYAPHLQLRNIWICKPCMDSER